MGNKLHDAIVQLEAIRSMNPSKFRRPLRQLRNMASDYTRFGRDPML